MSHESPKVLIEVCIESVDGALAAEAGGADRLELCGSLLEGGITPSAALLQQVVERSSLPVFCMVRPRGGDFLYTDLELETMLGDVRFAREHGASGVVFGCLKSDGDVDVGRVRRLADEASTMEITFHRAFDVARDRTRALTQLIELGVDRILSSGGMPTALEGADELTRLIERADERIVIMPGSGVRPTNAEELVARTGATEVHFSARATRRSAVEFRNGDVRMGASAPPGEYELSVTDVAAVRAMRAALG